MCLRLQYILIYLISSFNVITNNPYCEISCGKGWSSRMHTICIYDPCEIGFNCAPEAKMIKFQPEEQQFLSHLHNFYRNDIASGYYKPSYQGSNLKLMTYDKELEFIAQCHANTCPWRHDRCRKTLQLEEVGQNMYFGTLNRIKNPRSREHIRTALQEWFSEILYLKENIITSYKRNQSYNRVSQLLWANTNRIGCGRTQTSKNLIIIICNYAVEGNVESSPIYLRGKPCNNCTKCDSKYQALCTDVLTHRTHIFSPPFSLNASQNGINKLFLVLVIFLIFNI